MSKINDGIYVSPLSGLIFRAGMEFTNWPDFWPYYAEAWLLGWPEKEIKWFKTADKDWAECSWAGGAGVGNYFDEKNPKVTITLEGIPQQTYENTPKSFDLAACAAGLKRGEQWLCEVIQGKWHVIPTSSLFFYNGIKYVPQELLDILEARKAAEGAEKQPEPIPPEPQGMDFEEAWEVMKGKTVFAAWPEHRVSFYYYTTPNKFAEMKTVADRLGGKPFYLTQEEAKAHAEWLAKYGEGR